MQTEILTTELAEEAPAQPRRWATAVSVVVSLAIVAGAIVAGVRVSLPDGEDLLDELLPHEPGTTWVFRASGGDGRDFGLVTQTVTGTALLGGDRSGWIVSTHWDDFLGNGPIDTTAYYGRRGSRIVTFGDGVRRTYNGDEPAYPVYVLPMQPGQTWSYEGKNGSTEHTATTRVIEREDHEVLGTTLRGCLRIVEEHVYGENDQRNEGVVCPGVGAIRSHVTSKSGNVDLRQELVGFRAPGSSLGTVPPGSELGALPGHGTSGPGLEPGRSGWVATAGDVDVQRLGWSLARRSRIDFPPVGGGGTLFFAEQDGQVWAMRRGTGEVLWRTSFTKPIVAAPVLDGSTLLIADGRKSLFALDASTGRTRWAARFRDVVSSAPAVVAGTIMVATEDRTIHGLDAAGGQVAWSVGTDEVVTAAPAVAGELAVFADDAGGVIALAADGATAWTASIDALAAPPVADGRIVVVAGDGDLQALDARTGELRWRRSLAADVDTAPVLGDGRVVAITSGTHRMTAFSAENGDELWHREMHVDVSRQPVALADRLLVLSDEDPSPALLTYDLTDGAPLGRQVLPRWDRAQETDASTPMNVVDDELVVTLRGSGIPAALVYAFPLRADAPAGIRFSGRLRTVPGPAEAPPALAGDTIVYSDWTHTVWAVPSSGAPRALVKSKEKNWFVHPAGDVVLVHDGAQLKAVPLAGGEPRWAAPVGEKYPGFEPVVSGGVVVAPLRGAGLMGLDLQTGTPRWAIPIEGQTGGAPPLVLPGGDVVYAGGGLRRIDPATGAVRWHLPGAETFAPLAFDGSRVYLSGFIGEPGALVAVDASSGALAWATPFSAGLGSGPAVQDGVVVAADDAGKVHGVLARDGTSVWSAQLRGPANRSPVVLDGRVFIGALARREDAYARDTEVNVLDVRTGRFLGAYEPAGNPYTPLGETAAGADALLVPTLGTHGFAILELRAVQP